jgi:hypothetical protein
VYVRSFLLGVVTGLALIPPLVYLGVLIVPSRWNPWAPLAIADAPNVLTRYKMSRLDHDPAACIAALAGAQMRFTPLPDRESGPGCGFTNAVRVEATTAGVEPFSLSCRSAVALALWERHFMQPAAVRDFGVPVARLEHFGSYACRNVNGSASGRRSQHATADALDVAAFVLRDGRRISVRTGWNGNPREREFLREIHAGACRVFDTVLGPEYNASHHDHLHLDRGSFHVCR